MGKNMESGDHDVSPDNRWIPMWNSCWQSYRVGDSQEHTSGQTTR